MSKAKAIYECQKTEAGVKRSIEFPRLIDTRRSKKERKRRRGVDGVDGGTDKVALWTWGSKYKNRAESYKPVREIQSRTQTMEKERKRKQTTQTREMR